MSPAVAGFSCFRLLVVLHLSLTVQDQAEDETQIGQREVRGQTLPKFATQYVNMVLNVHRNHNAY